MSATVIDCFVIWMIGEVKNGINGIKVNEQTILSLSFVSY